MKTTGTINIQTLNMWDAMTKKTGALLKAVAILCFLTFNSYQLSAQGPKKVFHCNLGIENFSSANGHGAFYSPAFAVSDYRNRLSMGFLVHKRSMETGGFRLTYQYNLTADPGGPVRNAGYVPERDIFQINIFGYAQYNNNVKLSFDAVKEESCKNSVEGTDWNNMRLSTCEIGAGVRLQVNITETFSLYSSAGPSFYYHCKYISGMNHARMGPGLYLGIGMNIQLK